MYKRQLPPPFPLNVDANLQHFCWTVMLQDLPALDPFRLAPPNQMVATISSLRFDRAAERADDVARRTTDSPPTPPSKVLPTTPHHALIHTSPTPTPPPPETI